MLPRDKNGVVDASLRVYGTRNIRVVDLSIAPLHVAAHTQCKYSDLEQRIKIQTVSCLRSDRLCDRRASS